MSLKRICKSLRLLLAVLCVGLASCTEHFMEGNLYTFRGETVGSYLEKNADLYGHFIDILNRTGYMSLMKAYGTYTCFAPTDEAIERFAYVQDSIWRASLQPESDHERWTGVTSPRWEEFSDSMCLVIARTHILSKTVLSMDFDGSDVLRQKNLNDRFLTVSYGVNEELRSLIYINDALLLLSDQEVENGVIHTMADVVNPSALMVPQQIAETPFLSIFDAALRMTGLDGAMQEYVDMDYVRIDESYAATRYYGYTAFCETNEVFARYGIYNVEDLLRQCQKWYPEATDPDPHSPDNALNRFMRYHLLDRKLLYSRAVCYGIEKYQNGSLIFTSEGVHTIRSDRNEYFETLQGTMLKVSRPLSVLVYGSELILNFSKEHINNDGAYHCPAGKRGAMVNVHVLRPEDVRADEEHYPQYNQDALNGTILLIDEPLIYDEDVMVGSVLHEPIRLDVASLLPELTTNNIRYGDNPDFPMSGYYEVCLIPPGYSNSLQIYTPDPHFRYVGNSISANSYEGDEIIFDVEGDIAVRLPHVPEGTYELRLAYTSYDNRATVQFYVDNVITGIPVDMSILANNPLVGWVRDSETPDNGVANDKQMKNRGYLKGLTTQKVINATLTGRDSPQCLRLVLTTKYFSKGDHWVRVKPVGDNTGKGVQLDYLELVPVGWLRDDSIPLEDKRK